jgi:hypothetical protein
MIQGEILRLDVDDILSAALIPGRKRPLNGNDADVHSADALLVSRAVPVVAVADGPERNPGASSSFLKKFDDALAASPIRFVHTPPADSFAAVVELVNALIRTVDYHDSTTFSALIPVTDGGRPAGIVLHTGDSLILRIDGKTGDVSQISRTSHVLVGRAQKLFQTEIVPIGADDLIVLASDGITDLARTKGVVPAALLSAGVPTHGCRAVVQHIVDSAADTPVRLDDITIVCTAPAGLLPSPDEPAPKRVILT